MHKLIPIVVVCILLSALSDGLFSAILDLSAFSLLIIYLLKKPKTNNNLEQ